MDRPLNLEFSGQRRESILIFAERSILAMLLPKQNFVFNQIKYRLGIGPQPCMLRQDCLDQQRRSVLPGTRLLLREVAKQGIVILSGRLAHFRSDRLSGDADSVVLSLVQVNVAVRFTAGQIVDDILDVAGDIVNRVGEEPVIRSGSGKQQIASVAGVGKRDI